MLRVHHARLRVLGDAETGVGSRQDARALIEAALSRAGDRVARELGPDAQLFVPRLVLRIRVGASDHEELVDALADALLEATRDEVQRASHDPRAAEQGRAVLLRDRHEVRAARSLDALSRAASLSRAAARADEPSPATTSEERLGASTDPSQRVLAPEPVIAECEAAWREALDEGGSSVAELARRLDALGVLLPALRHIGATLRRAVLRDLAPGEPLLAAQQTSSVEVREAALTLADRAGLPLGGVDRERVASLHVPTSRPDTAASRTPEPTRTEESAAEPDSRGAVDPTATTDSATIDTALVVPLVTATDCAGLVTLLGLAMRLELPEHLWCAGVPEGRALRSVLAALVAEERTADPLLALVSHGAPPLSEAIEDWKREEILTKLDAALSLDAELRDARDAYAATIDAHIEEAATSRFVALVAASLVAGVAARAALTIENAHALVANGSALVRVSPGLVVIHRPMRDIDLALRRAALDVDPGYLPWLEQDWRVVFDASDSDVW